MKTAFSFLFAGIFLCTALVAQPIRMRGYHIISGCAGSEGYYALNEVDRKVKTGENSETYTMPQVIHFDRNLQPQWAVDFSEAQMRTLRGLACIRDRIFVWGNQYPKSHLEGHAWLVCLDLQGKLVWQQTLQEQGYATLESNGLYAGPDGDLIWITTAFRQPGSYGHPMVLRIGMDGKERWRKAYCVNSAMAQFQACKVLTDGNLFFTGGNMKLASDMADNVHTAAIFKVDANNGNLLWERILSPKERSYWPGIQVLPDGGVRLAGSCGTRNGHPEATVLRLDAKGNVVDRQTISLPAEWYLVDLVPDVGGKGWWAHGVYAEYDLELNKGHNILMQLDDDLKLVSHRAYLPRLITATMQGPGNEWVAFSWDYVVRIPTENAAAQPSPAKAPNTVSAPHRLGEN